jgi:hypothetical protein
MKRRRFQYTQPFSFTPSADQVMDAVANQADYVASQGFWPKAVNVTVLPTGAGWYSVRVRVEAA